MSSLDLDLFHKLKGHMRGHHFPSVEEVSPTVTQAIQAIEQKWYSKWNGKSSKMLGRGH
jgi:hypothetical protein